MAEGSRCGGECVIELLILPLVHGFKSLVETELEILALVASSAFSHTEKRYCSFLGNTVPFFTRNPVFVRMFWGSVAVEILFSETRACVWLVPAGLALLAPL